LLTHLSQSADSKEVNDIYVADYGGNHQLINIEKAMLLTSKQMQSPMAGNVAGFSKLEEFNEIKNRLNGTEIKWQQLVKP